jgi:hypothetical protein
MQNEKTLQQLIREHEINMPPEIMNLIKSFDWKKEVRTIVNQNQLMIDVGGDLEESIYLVLLGVVTAEELYNRLIETHEVPEDKAQKIIQEAESQIFSPMYKKLMELPSEDEEDKTAKPATPRDAILAEIEKEPEIFVNLNVASIKSNTMSNIIETPSSQNVGIVKPFSMNQIAPLAEKKEIPQEKKTEIVTSPPSFNMAAVTGVQEDPVASLLTQPTQVQAASPVVSPKPYTADPYREPIE